MKNLNNYIQKTIREIENKIKTHPETITISDIEILNCFKQYFPDNKIKYNTVKCIPNIE